MARPQFYAKVVHIPKKVKAVTEGGFAYFRIQVKVIVYMTR